MTDVTESPTCPELVRSLIKAGYAEPFSGLVKREYLPAVEFWFFARQWVLSASRAAKNEESPFEAFIYLWVALNGWATQVVQDPLQGELTDAIVVAALGQDAVLSK